MSNLSLNNQSSVSKKHETISNVKVFNELPNLLIQDSEKENTFYIPSNEMEQFLVNGNTWEKMTPGTVTFVIPDENYFEEAPPFTQYGVENPPVLVQFPKGESAYFLTYEDLQPYKIERPESHPVGTMSFVIPRGTELWEELPRMKWMDLQSNEV